MIVFDLSCDDGHRFEGWFRSSSDYEDQGARGLIACPHCGSGEVGKAPMAPAASSHTTCVAEAESGLVLRAKCLGAGENAAGAEGSQAS